MTDWHSFWQQGRIGFHEGRPNRFLERYADRLASRPRVLVPLCGKTEDLAFLASRGHQVVGIELVEDAVRAFFAEHGVTPTVRPRGPFVEYASESITLLCGDMFAATRELLGPIDAVYDRAALVALPDEIRRRYVDLVRRLAGRGGAVLVVTLDYDQELMSGPPFAISEAELRALYDDTQIELLAEEPETRVRPAGPPITERCYAITL
ncbi:MAG: thiopurine S-methyltransferase [Kofleriaceae bacterium]